MCFLCVQARGHDHDHTHGRADNHIEVTQFKAGEVFGYSTKEQASAASTDWTSYINTIADGLSWDTNGTSVETTITYTFSLISDHSALRYSSLPRIFTTAEQTTTLAVFDAIEAFANVEFVEATTAESANISLYVGNLNLAAGAAGIAGYYFSGNEILDASIGMDDDYSDFETSGTFDFSTLLHEVGHAIGLKHSGNYGSGDTGPFLPTSLDNEDNTVMSYNSGTQGNATEYRDLDVAAIQYLYGEAPDSSSGGGSDPDSSTGSPTDGDDVITATDNTLTTGGGGSDTITGSSGNDSIYGGSSIADNTDASDSISGGDGNDLILGNSGNDTIYGGDSSSTTGDGSDTIYGGFGNDVIFGNGDNDSLAGGGGIAHPDDEADTIDGGAGNDSIVGNGDDDLISGGTGDDVIYGGIGGDTIDGGDGSDFIAGQFGNETLTGGSGGDTFWFGGNDGVDTITDYNLLDILGFFSGFGGFSSASDIFSNANVIESGGSTIISWSTTDTTITLTGYTGLIVDDFAIVSPISLTDAL